MNAAERNARQAKKVVELPKQVDPFTVKGVDKRPAPKSKPITTVNDFLSEEKPKAADAPKPPSEHTIRGAVNWCKDALASKDLVAHLTYYMVKEGKIYASDGRMVACHPIMADFGKPLFIPGVEFERVLNAMPTDNPELRLDEGKLIVRHGKFRGKLSVASEESWPYEAGHEGKWTLLPKGLLEAIKKIRPFVSDNATQLWATCASLRPGFIYATNNVVVARASVPELTGDILLPAWAIDFLLPRVAGATHFAVSENAIFFKWDSGAWLKTFSMGGTFPEKAGNMIDSCGKASFATSPEWRATFKRVADLTGSGGTIKIYPTRMVGSGEGELEVEDSAVTTSPEGEECSIWDSGYLSPVIEIATAWNPAAWPKPARWQGDGIDGIVLGRR